MNIQLGEPSQGSYSKFVQKQPTRFFSILIFAGILTGIDISRNKNIQ
jgi:hypothetical protein